MTCAELIAELQKYNPGMPVLATWENVFAGIRPDNFKIEESDGRQQLTLDVDAYG